MRVDQSPDDLTEGKHDVEEELGDQDEADGAAASATDVISAETVEEILRKYAIPAYASKAIPVPLRVRRVHFAGVKRLPATHQLAAGHDVIVPADGFAMDTADPAPCSDFDGAEWVAAVPAAADDVDITGDEPAEGDETESTGGRRTRVRSQFVPSS